MKLTDILKDSNYKLTQFSQEKISILENSIYIVYVFKLNWTFPKRIF
jgi:hypothetical protein